MSLLHENSFSGFCPPFCALDTACVLIVIISEMNETPRLDGIEFSLISTSLYLRLIRTSSWGVTRRVLAETECLISFEPMPICLVLTQENRPLVRFAVDSDVFTSTPG